MEGMCDVAERKGVMRDTDGKTNPARKPNPMGPDGDAEFRGYVNLNLSSAEKELFDEWADTDAPLSVLDATITDGVHLSLRIDRKGECFLASATQRNRASENAGLVVTARASSPVKALMRVLFCLSVLGRSPRWEDTQPVADPDRW